MRGSHSSSCLAYQEEDGEDIVAHNYLLLNKTKTKTGIKYVFNLSEKQ